MNDPRRIFLLVWSAFLTFQFGAHAAPASPDPVILTQPNGYEFEAVMKGDELAHWMQTTDGYTVVNDNGEWAYAELDNNGYLVPSTLRVGNATRSQIAGIVPGLTPPIDIENAEEHTPIRFTPSAARGVSFSQPVLLIAASFNDTAFTYAPSTYQPLIFGASNSVKDFYLENSYNAFNITQATESYGTANDGLVEVSINSNHPDAGSASLAQTAIGAADPYVNFAAYDTDADGIVSPQELSIILIIAGYEESYSGAPSPNIWAHMSSGMSLFLDGKSLFSYCMFGERHGGHQATIGIMCHELGHLMLGLPDLYDRDGSSSGISRWGLMAGGSWNYTGGNWSGNMPAHLCAWSKDIVGFVTPETIVASVPGVSILDAGNNASIKEIWIDQYKSPIGERFLIENRQLTGYDQGMQGVGLAIYHIAGYVRSQNDNEALKLVDVEEADGIDSASGTSWDSFPGLSGNTTFTNFTTPDSKEYTGATNGITVTNISASANTMTATMTPRNIALGETIHTDSEYISVSSWGYGSTTVWSALQLTNNTVQDSLEGFDVYIRDTGATVDFYWYQSLSGTTPTTLLHSQTGFVAAAGEWNRFFLTTPQSFPVGSTRVLVLKIVNNTPGANWPAAVDRSEDGEGTSFIDANGLGSFTVLGQDLAQHALVGGLTIDNDNIWVQYSFTGTEYGVEPAPFNTLLEGYQTVNSSGTIHVKNGGSTSEPITLSKPLTITNN